MQFHQAPKPSTTAFCWALIACLAPVTLLAGGSDWPTFLGPTGDGKSPEKLPFDSPPARLPILWEHSAGEGYSAPAVADGRVLLFDRHGDQARLTALDSNSGKLLWKTEYPTAYEDMYGFSNGPRATPVIDGDRIYAFGVEGRLRCHRAQDGSVLWDVDTQRRYGVVQNFFGVGSTPVVENNLLIVPVGGSPQGSPGVRSGKVKGADSGLVAFDKSTGKEIYRFSNELASYSSPVLSTINGRRWGFLLARGGLLGFDPKSGKADFHFPWRASKIESVNAANPVVIGDRVFITESYGPGSALLRAKEGGYELLWKDPPRGKSLACHWNTPIHHRGYLYASSGSGGGDAELRCVELATGKVMWKRSGLTRSTLIYVDGHLIVLGERGGLWLIKASPRGYQQVADWTPMNPKAEDEESKHLIRFPAWNPPALAHGRLYVRSKDRLFCFGLGAGAPRAGAP